MINASSIISMHSSDTAGVCSSLFELGGMTVVHDASGCNSTYATHDEPRWYDFESMTYISGLTEADAIMGNDDKIISDVTETALKLKPAFITLCGSPMPMMIGTDFAALAEEIEQRCRIPVMGLQTNGIRSYLHGMGDALSALAERFCVPGQQKDKSVNILGATPLDFSINGQVQDMAELVKNSGFELRSVWAMGSSLEELISSGNAGVNLVISSGALKLAEYMERQFGIPYVAGVPMGKGFSHRLVEDLKKSLEEGRSIISCAGNEAERSRVLVVGESLYSSSLARALEMQGSFSAVTAVNVLEEEFALPGSITALSENQVTELFSGAEAVFADPLYAPVIPENVRFYPLPHEAFSGRCFRKDMKNFIGKDIPC